MAETTYTYALSTDFPGGAINSKTLTAEIAASSIITALERIDTDGDVIDVVFKAALSAGDKTTLDNDVTTGSLMGGLIGAHDNTPSPTGEPKQTEDGVLYMAQQVQSVGLEMCDRDILIKTAIYDTKATLTVSGATGDGDVLYTAVNPGTRGNTLRVEHLVGATGAGNEDRALAAVLVGGITNNLTVTFGTDGSGNSVVPTANEIAAVVNVPPTAMMVVAVPQGDGTGNAAAAALAALTGGLSPSLEDIKINPTTFVKAEWGELQQVGCYKDGGGGTFTPCTDQSDATTNAILSVWRYCAHDQATGLPISVEIRDGHLIVASDITDVLDHQAYAIAAPQIPAAVGGSIVQFDAYLKFYKGKVLGATSPQAKALDPLGPGGAAGGELRVYIYYPAGTQNDHILRLVTYRPAGTF